MKQAKYRFCALLLLCSLGVARASIDTDRPTPPPTLVQARVFRNLSLQDFTLEGEIHNRTDTFPIELQTHGHEMVYQFKTRPLQIRVLFDPMGATLFRREGVQDPWKQVTGAALLEPILNTDVTYEDLGLSFIFWDKLIGLGCDSIKTLPAWAFEATPPPGTPTLYTKVRYWVSSDYYAFLRVDGYNDKDQVIKRVEVNGVRKIGDAYVMEEMQISTMIPALQVLSSRTYINIDSGTPGSGIH